MPFLPQGKLLDFLRRISISEVPGAIAAIDALRLLLSAPNWDSEEYRGQLAEAIIKAAREGADVTVTESDDEIIEMLVPVVPFVVEFLPFILDRFSHDET